MAKRCCKKNEAINLISKFAPNSVLSYDLLITHGDGIYVYDDEGKRYIDMSSGLAVANFGHGHPRLLKALFTQATKISSLCRLFHNEALPLFLERACQLTNMDRAFPINTGVDAVEAAIKIARKWGYVIKHIPENKAEIIVCNNNFHGRTVTAISMSSTKQYQHNFGPLTPGFKLIDFNNPKALEQAITENTAAFIVEPIQGEAGVIIPDANYLQLCQKICDNNNVLFILDEIQTGMGRTGKFLASQHAAVVPDGILLGKALGGGFFPVSLFLSKEEVMNVIEPGDHGSTFGGNPLASYIAYEALNTLIDERLPENAMAVGNYFIEQLNKIDPAVIKTVRGRGLLIAVEIATDIYAAKQIWNEFIKYGLLSIYIKNGFIRLIPPLIITKHQIDDALNIIKQALNSVSIKL